MSIAIVYILSCLVAAGLALVLTPCAIRFAKTYRIYDVPDCRKVHSNPIPRFGGAAVYLACVFSFFAVSFFLKLDQSAFESLALPLVMGATLMFLVGLWDDIRNLSAGQKILFELFATLYLCSAGYRVESCVLCGTEIVFPTWFSWGLSIVWIIGLTNAINLTDGLDGLAAGVSAMTCSFLAIICFICGQVGLCAFLFAVTGALMGFLVFNSNPAKIFLGDCGSLFLGFVLAGTSVMIAKNGTVNHYMLLLATFMIPLMDTLLIMCKRFLDRRSIFSPDQNHFHHRLLNFGCHHQQAVLVIYAITFAGLLCGLVAVRAQTWVGLVLCGGLMVAVLMIFKSVGAFHLKEMVEGVKQKVALRSQIKNELSRYETIELSFQKAQTLDQWWQAVCSAAERLAIGGLTLSSGDNPNEPVYRWGSQDFVHPAQSHFSMTVPVHHEFDDKLFTLCVELGPGQSFESSGRMLTLFARLIDKYGQIQMPDYKPPIFMHEMVVSEQDSLILDSITQECVLV